MYILTHTLNSISFSLNGKIFGCITVYCNCYTTENIANNRRFYYYIFLINFCNLNGSIR